MAHEDGWAWQQRLRSRRWLMSVSVAAGVAAIGSTGSTRGATVQLEDGVDEFVEQFYAAYNEALNGDPEPMLALWSQEPYVSAMHAVGGDDVGWEQVSAAWRNLSRVVSSGTMSFDSLVSHTNGEMAFVAGIEQGSLVINDDEVAYELRVTNIFERQDGEWKAIHHHGDADPAFEALLAR